MRRTMKARLMLTSWWMMTQTMDWHKKYLDPYPHNELGRKNPRETGQYHRCQRAQRSRVLLRPWGSSHKIHNAKGAPALEKKAGGVNPREKPCGENFGIICTNTTGIGNLFKVLEHAKRASVILVQETKVAEHDTLKVRERLKKLGWYSVWSPSAVSQLGGKSAGVAIPSRPWASPAVFRCTP